MAKRGAQGDGSIRKKTITRNGKSYTYWEARYTEGRNAVTGNQLQRSITGRTQAEVRQKLKAATQALDKGTYIEPTKITVTQWLTEWINTYCKGHRKPLTVARYQSTIDNHIIPIIGAEKLNTLRVKDVQKVENAMLTAGLSPKTVKDALAVLHRALNVARMNKLIEANPCNDVEPVAAPHREINPLSDADVPKFLSAISGHKFENAYALCLLAGLREGECLGLSWSCVDFRAGKLTIRQQLQASRETGGGYYIADSTKSGKARTIKLPAKAFDYLRAEKVRQIENRFAAGELWANDNDLVFTTDKGRPIPIVTFYKNFKRIAAAIGRPDARPHDLRHTAATIAIANGADIKSVQTLLGHSSASITLNVYAHTSDKMMEDTAARVQSYYDNLNKQA